MAQRVNLDAMIKREDFAREIKDAPPPETIRELNLSMLLSNAPIRRQLRKPDFQRETNHWTPDQVLHFIKSFLDGAVIPGVILWRSTNFIFVIDGAHRLSALCAWISDDYGDRAESKSFYNDDIPKLQERIAKRIRYMIDREIGNFRSLEMMVGKSSADVAGRRADVAPAGCSHAPSSYKQLLATPRSRRTPFSRSTHRVRRLMIPRHFLSKIVESRSLSVLER